MQVQHPYVQTQGGIWQTRDPPKRLLTRNFLSLIRVAQGKPAATTLTGETRVWFLRQLVMTHVLSCAYWPLVCVLSRCVSVSFCFTIFFQLLLVLFSTWSQTNTKNYTHLSQVLVFIMVQNLFLNVCQFCILERFSVTESCSYSTETWIIGVPFL